MIKLRSRDADAVAAMISDVRKSGLCDNYQYLIAAGVRLRDAAAVRDWIEKF